MGRGFNMGGRSRSQRERDKRRAKLHRIHEQEQLAEIKAFKKNKLHKANNAPNVSHETLTPAKQKDNLWNKLLKWLGVRQ